MGRPMSRKSSPCNDDTGKVYMFTACSSLMPLGRSDPSEIAGPVFGRVPAPTPRQRLRPLRSRVTVASS